MTRAVATDLHEMQNIAEHVFFLTRGIHSATNAGQVRKEAQRPHMEPAQGDHEAFHPVLAPGMSSSHRNNLTAVLWGGGPVSFTRSLEWGERSSQPVALSSGWCCMA